MTRDLEFKVEGQHMKQRMDFFMGGGDWNYKTNTYGEVWFVQAVCFQYNLRTGTLQIKFLCDAQNAEGESFKAK